MIKSLFEYIFKFKQIQFSEGEIAFLSGSSFYFLLFLFASLITGIVYLYYITKVYHSPRTRFISFFLRITALLILCIPLLQPVLLVSDIVPGDNFLVVLADKSASMSIPDGRFEKTRDDDVNFILNGGESAVLPQLEENFKIRYYTFSGESGRADSLTSRLPDGTATNISGALKRIASDFKGLPLTGIVMLTDGGDNSREDPYDIAKDLQNLNIPLHIVGTGSESFKQERELLDLSTSKGLEEGTGAEINIKVRSWIEETEPVTFTVYRDENPVYSNRQYLKGNGKTDNFTFFFEPEEKGAIKYSLKIDRLPEEINLENNSLNMLIDTQKDTIRVLYIEGRLRSDFKFIKRSLEADQVFEFTSVSRTGTGRYFRQGIKDPDELKNGFPATEEEMFRFKAVILGDMERSFFTDEQFTRLEKFVRQRGGGFLMLGGLHSFSGSDYWNSGVADIIPVEFDPRRTKKSEPEATERGGQRKEYGFKFVPTREGLENPILKLASEKGTNRAIWNDMPNLTSINYFGGVKPGATVLAKKLKDHFGEEEPLLIIQRYGRGRSAVLGTASTWRWKMLQDSKNDRHERFWRQMGRWLVASALDKVNIDIAENVVGKGQNIPIKINVFDEDYDPLNFAEVTGTITGPDGESREVVFHPDLSQEGEYAAGFTPTAQGVYRISAEAKKDEILLGSARQSFLSTLSKKEYYDATLKSEFLENLAAKSGGVYYTPENAAEIPVNLKIRKSETSVTETEYLWDMPLLFIIAIILLGIEWFYRRRKGMP